MKKKIKKLHKRVRKLERRLVRMALLIFWVVHIVKMKVDSLPLFV